MDFGCTLLMPPESCMRCCCVFRHWCCRSRRWSWAATNARIGKGRRPLLSHQFKSPALVGRDMIGLVALDFVLGTLLRGTMRVTFIIEVLCVDGNDGPRHPARFGMPAYMIADLESFSHVANSSFSEVGRPSTPPHHYGLHHAHCRRESPFVSWPAHECDRAPRHAAAIHSCSGARNRANGQDHDRTIAAARCLARSLSSSHLEPLLPCSHRAAKAYQKEAVFCFLVPPERK